MAENKRLLGLGTWITSGSATVTEVISHLSFDWLLFDLEHGAMTQHHLLDNIRAVQGRSKVIVRIGELSPSVISRALDWGADGIMMPHVNHAEDARKVLRMMSYPPRGERGYSGSSRCYGYGAFPPVDIRKSDQPLLITQIETVEGLQNVTEIAAVEGVDVLFVGQSDLKLDLSAAREDKTMRIEDALQEVANAAKQYNLMAGTLVRDMNQIRGLKQMGYSTLAVTSDLGAIRAGYKDILGQLE